MYMLSSWFSGHKYTAYCICSLTVYFHFYCVLYSFTYYVFPFLLCIVFVHILCISTVHCICSHSAYCIYHYCVSLSVIWDVYCLLIINQLLCLPCCCHDTRRYRTLLMPALRSLVPFEIKQLGIGGSISHWKSLLSFWSGWATKDGDGLIYVSLNSTMLSMFFPPPYLTFPAHLVYPHLPHTFSISCLSVRCACSVNHSISITSSVLFLFIDITLHIDGGHICQFPKL